MMQSSPPIADEGGGQDGSSFVYIPRESTSLDKCEA